MLPTDPGLRQLLLAALADVAQAERDGRWLDAAVALELVVSELRARAANRVSPSLEAGRRSRELVGWSSR